MIPCESTETAHTVNQIVLALSYSYIAAAIFHFVTIFCPHKKRLQDISPLLEYNLLCLKDKIRLCYLVTLPPYDLRQKKYDKIEYVKRFTFENLYQDYAFDKGKSKQDKLHSLRKEINDIINLLMAYREYLKDDAFQFLNDISTSFFMTNDIIPNDIEYKNNNQEQIGESIFDLYEKSIGFHYNS